MIDICVFLHHAFSVNVANCQGRENCLEGLTFVITGVFESIDREETKSLILKHGGKVTSNVTRTTKYLVAGRDCGQSKLDKVRRTVADKNHLV